MIAGRKLHNLIDIYPYVFKTQQPPPAHLPWIYIFLCLIELILADHSDIVVCIENTV